MPPWSESNIHRINRQVLKLKRKHGPAIELHAGRHYPQYIATATAGIFAGNVKPLRIVAMDAETVTVDLNHPLARSPLTISARNKEHLGPASEHGGRCNDIIMDTMANGVGLETLYPVQEYFRTAGNFASLETETVHGLPRPQDDKYVQQRAFSDPVFAARAVAVG